MGILPSADGVETSDAVDIMIVTGMGSARNSINILSSDVVVACGNAEAGTLSEIAMALKAKKPVVLLTEDDEAQRFLERSGRGLLQSAKDPEEVVAITRDLLGRQISFDPRAVADLRQAQAEYELGEGYTPIQLTLTQLNRAMAERGKSETEG